MKFEDMISDDMENLMPNNLKIDICIADKRGNRQKMLRDRSYKYGFTQKGQVITWIKLLIHSQTSTVAPLMFGNG